jgi:diguanylate cyclase (GGDEF)-like protein
LAFVDVDGLKAINDSRGHGAGDQVLLDVANALRATLRSHDLIIRYGGDEFACVISGLNTADATKRLALVNTALARASEPASVTVGVTELQPNDSSEDLLARVAAGLGQPVRWRGCLHACPMSPFLRDARDSQPRRGS